MLRDLWLIFLRKKYLILILTYLAGHNNWKSKVSSANKIWAVRYVNNAQKLESLYDNVVIRYVKNSIRPWLPPSPCICEFSSPRIFLINYLSIQIFFLKKNIIKRPSRILSQLWICWAISWVRLIPLLYCQLMAKNTTCLRKHLKWKFHI